MKVLANTANFFFFAILLTERILLLFGLLFFATVDLQDGDQKSAFDSTFEKTENYK